MSYEDQKAFQNLPCSYWLASMEYTDYPALAEDIQTDVVIIGGGMAGLLCAYELQNEGLRVALLEAGRITRGTTSHTTAKITSQHGLIYNKIKMQRGSEPARQYAEANESAIRKIKEIADIHHIDCDYVPQSAFVYTQQDKNIQKIEDEVTAASEFGIQASYVDEIPFRIPIKAAVRFDHQAQFHPVKFLLPLAEKMVSSGVQIFENSRVVELEYNDEVTVKTSDGKKVKAKKAIIASHYPFYNKHGMYYMRIYTERTYIVAIHAEEKYPGGMYVNAEDPSRSLRCQNTEYGELILVVGDNHKTGQGEDMSRHYHNLIDFADEIFTIKKIPFRWSTQDCMTLDGVPYVGHYKSDMPNLYLTTGFEKWGMTNSMVSAQIIRDLIIKGSSPWQDVYDPSRQNILGSAKTFIVENLDLAKHLIKGKVAPIPEDVKLEPGEGKVVEAEGERTGAFRDDNGQLHLVNTTCTHMGCELNWNSAERSWDCPCHGSRFTVTGDIVDGPAVEPLTYENNVNTLGKVIKEDF